MLYLLLFYVLGFAIIGVNKYEKEASEVTKITITEGDTLWGLALSSLRKICRQKNGLKK